MMFVLSTVHWHYDNVTDATLTPNVPLTTVQHAHLFIHLFIYSSILFF